MGRVVNVSNIVKSNYFTAESIPLFYSVIVIPYSAGIADCKVHRAGDAGSKWKAIKFIETRY